MSKIKVLRIIARLNIGGPAVHVALLVNEMNAGDIESHLIYGSISKGEGDMSYLLGANNSHSIQLKSLRRSINPLFDLRALFSIFRFMKAYKPDIVHTHTAKAGTLGRIAASMAGVPVKVHTFHGNIFHGYFNRFTTPFFLFIERILSHFTDAIIAVSPAQAREIITRYKIGDSKKCKVVRLGFDIEKLISGDSKRGFLRDMHALKNEDILVGIVGRVVPVKNLKMFVEVARLIKDKSGENLRNKIKFMIIGDGEMKEALFEYVRSKKLNDSIFFSGWAKDMARVYGDLDIVVLTSVNEGTPVSLIEAMAFSKPVVATDVGGVRDALGGKGILVKSGDAEQMADKVLELAGSFEKREKIARDTKEYVQKLYSKKRLIDELRTLYRELLSKKHENKREDRR